MVIMIIVRERETDRQTDRQTDRVREKESGPGVRGFVIDHID